MAALCAALEPEFGDAKIFRPYRDVRFAKDKTPYKTHQGAFVARRPGDRLVRRDLGPRRPHRRRVLRGERPAAGRLPRGHRPRPLRPRAREDPRRPGEEGFEIGGDRLKTSPRGYDADHPRIELLRHKSLIAGHPLGFEPVIHTPELLDLVRDDWRALRPLVEWVAGRRPTQWLSPSVGRHRALGLPVRLHRRDPAVVVDDVDHDQVGVVGRRRGTTS